MTEQQGATPDLQFEYTLPAGWEDAPDEEGGVLLTGPKGVGLLHLVAFEQLPGELLDPAEELYAFLEDQEIELEEDEIEDIPLVEDSELALCEYVAEDDEEEDDEGEVYWMMAVATAPGNLLFCNYSCPFGEQDSERDEVRGILSSLRPRPLRRG